MPAKPAALPARMTSAVGAALRATRSPIVVVLLWLIAIGFALVVWTRLPASDRGIDAHAYWQASHRIDLYGPPPGGQDAFLYSPTFAQLFWPLTRLPWPGFYALWAAIESACFVWLLRPLRWRWGVPVFLLCQLEVFVGNIYGTLAVCVVLGATRPTIWVGPLLTKVTICLGPVWYAARGQWRAVRATVIAAVVVVLVSGVISPGDWIQWLRFLVHNGGASQWYFPVRLVSALAVTVLSARLGRRWPLAIAMVLANPVVVHAWMDLTMLAALPRLMSIDRFARTQGATTSKIDASPRCQTSR